MNLKSIEQGFEKLLGLVGPAIEADPAAQEAVTSTKQAIADAKTAVVSRLAGTASSTIASIFSPEIGPEAAAIAGQIASNAILAEIDKL